MLMKKTLWVGIMRCTIYISQSMNLLSVFSSTNTPSGTCCRLKHPVRLTVGLRLWDDVQWVLSSSQAHPLWQALALCLWWALASYLWCRGKADWALGLAQRLVHDWSRWVEWFRCVDIPLAYMNSTHWRIASLQLPSVILGNSNGK